MPAVVINFNAQVPLPTEVYLDTNFIIPLLQFVSSHPHSLSVPCKDFYDKLNGLTEINTSILAVQEAIYFYLFREGIAPAINTYNTHHNTDFDLRNLIRNDPTQYNSIYCQYFQRVPKLLKNLSNLGIKIVIPRYPKQVLQHAIDLMHRYLLQPNDAHHIAISLACGIRDIVTNDADFHRVNGITVYTHFSPFNLTLTPCP